MVKYDNNLALLRCCLWIVFAACAGRLSASPEFTFTMTCTPVSTYNWRVIASVNADMSSAFTINVTGSFTPSSPSSYPATQGPSSGTLGGYGSTMLYFRYQVQGAATGGVYADFGLIMGPVAADGTFDGSFEYTPPNCLPENINNPDIPVTIGNNNPYGGTFTPTVGGTPLPPPSEWPYPPIPPYTGPLASLHSTLEARQTSSLT
jgi:hypothetical protein